MKKIMMTIAILFCTFTMWAGNAPRGWTTDLDGAMKEANAKNRNVMILFTGSDWCSWCKRLNNDVLQRKAFQKYAKQNLVLVYFDFPFRKKIDPEQLAEQNRAAKKFDVRGYPTAIILNAKGKKLGVISGYRSEADYIKALEKFNGRNSGRTR